MLQQQPWVSLPLALLVPSLICCGLLGQESTFSNAPLASTGKFKIFVDPVSDGFFDDIDILAKALDLTLDQATIIGDPTNLTLGFDV